LREAISTGQPAFQVDEVERLSLEAIKAEAWEAKQGGLQAAAEAVKAWDRLDFRNALLAEVPRLLVDTEYRVRKAVSAVLLECCKRDGLRVYDDMGSIVLADIKEKFSRTEEVGDEVPDAGSSPAPPAPPEPPQFLPDTEGWRSLETSMGALEAMMQGCGAAFTPRIDDAMLELMAECSRHTNRFVREYAYFGLKSVFEVCDASAFLSSVAPKTVELVKKGIKDNWSQVRFASSVAVRAFMEKAAEHKDNFYSQLLGSMCLNRHYVAEGVRLYSQETWRQVCGPMGGARLLVAHFDSVIDAYVDAAEAPNHAVREAACNCISELAGRVAGSPAEPTPYREQFTHSRVQRLLNALLESFKDESWPVRDVASTALGHFVKAFPDETLAIRSQLLELWFMQMADNIPSLRRNGAAAVAAAVGVWPEELWPQVLPRLEKTLPEVLMQPEHSEIFTDYTPSGPFSVPKAKSIKVGDKADPDFTDQVMYSCGSSAPKTFKQRRARDSGCMNCAADMPHQLWEASEGMVHFLTELASLAVRLGGEEEQARLDALAALLPSFCKAYDASQYRHHHLLKQRVCERLAELNKAIGQQRMAPHLPELLRTTATCAGQGAHFGLREEAREVLALWRKTLPAEALEAACQAASLDLQVLGGA